MWEWYGNVGEWMMQTNFLGKICEETQRYVVFMNIVLWMAQQFDNLTKKTYLQKNLQFANKCVNCELMSQYNSIGSSSIEYCVAEDSSKAIDSADIGISTMQ